MTGASADRSTDLLAVIGASTPEGTRLREALAGAGVEGSRVNLFGSASGEAVISEYAGEARLVQEPALDAISAHNVLLLCESSRLAREAAERAAPDAVVIDLVGALETAERSMVHMGINPDAAQSDRGRFSIPHPLTLALAELLHPLDGSLVISEALAMVLRPAADFGQAGIDELREQTIRLMNFGEFPVEVFGRQLAFNVLTEDQSPRDTSGTASAIASGVGELLGWREPRLSVRLITAPMFYGHAIQLRLRFRGDPEPDRIRSALADQDTFTLAEDGGAATPIDVSAQPAARLSELGEDGLGAYWLWAVVGALEGRGALQAVLLLRALERL
jgi:aspartate-semialdehyde dehydrogenase